MRDILIMIGISILMFLIAITGIGVVESTMWDIIIAILCAIPIMGFMFYILGKILKE